jgi:hypothetical protein
VSAAFVSRARWHTRVALAAVLLAGVACGAEHAVGTHRAAAPTAAASARVVPGKPAPAVASAKAAAARATCDYHVVSPPAPPFVVRVTARCEGGGVSGFMATEPESGPFVIADEANGPGVYHAAKLARPGVAELSYSVDLDALARHADHVDVARIFGRSLLAPASSFILRPDPEEDDEPITIHFDSPGVESALERVGDAYRIASHELRVATYTTFGARETRDVAVRDATIRVVVLDGALDLPADELARWVKEAAQGVADFFHRPPAARTLVVLAPLPDRHGIPFGKMLPANAPGVIVLIGEHTEQRELTDDWVLVHELFHVGTPSFVGEAKWYDEGLATYFEPLIRARLGWRGEADVWREFLTNMPRGLAAMTRRGLEHPERYPDMYWGGGLFCLLADVELRRRYSGTAGLEDGVRNVLSWGGSASKVWSLARVIEITDRRFPAPILAPLVAAHAEHGSPVDLDGLFRSLGVSLGPKGNVRFDEHAPLAGIRHSVVYGTGEVTDPVGVPAAH